ncbi:MAG: putative transcriptional regulator [Methanolobus sp.]|jgi:DNA-binding XRE family transcriptional regulator|nr:putative transcriptional regulator [Methanolobus sp.]MDK2832465.1 putative transcriptional regulator [Methanolobus sp.]MDK2939225.1 putative transcriptional regulator [Methanolobus sp.]
MVSFQERRYRINPQMQDDKMKTRIKELRARYDLTQEDLANKVGVRRETIGFLEKGKYNPSLKLAYKVAITLETTIDELFIFDEFDLK